mmetsp:Transcript_78070/g.137760  ORF Transcript_78070/g.137760 Transcript_78070/m.137760 type:complete len:306 (-) Transcript_78070:561-1478(-)
MADAEFESLVGELSPASREILHKYFLWSKKKRSLHVKDIEGELYEYKAASLIDESYNKSDVSDILGGLLAILKVTVEKEQKETTQTFAEMLRGVLLSADKVGVELSADVGALDNPGVIGTIGLLEKNVLDGKGALGSLGGLGAKPKLGGAAPLAPISAAPEVPAGPSERETELEAENKRLQDKLKTIQQQYTTMMGEKSKLSQELNAIKDGSQADASNAAARVHSLEKELEELKSVLSKKEGEIAAGQKQLTGKLNDSSQFKTLKKLLAQKTQQVKELRTKLQQYEPESSGTIEAPADDDSSDGE